jgi:hypothetical protein
VTKKQNTLYGAIGLFLGIVSGISGTAFSMGAEQQRIKSKIMAIEIHQKDYEAGVEKEMDRYAEIIADHIVKLTENVTRLNTSVGDLRIDVQVLKVLMERLEKDLCDKSSSS